MDYLDITSTYILQADQYLKQLFYSIAPIYKPENGNRQDVTVPLFTTLHSTSESILILLLHSGLFDADILLRCVMEGTIKYCYLMNGDENEKNSKYIEYKEKLYEIAKISDHKKAVEAVEILKEFSENSTKPFEIDILEGQDLTNLQAKYPSKLQNEIKNKWSYQQMLRDLAQNNTNYKAQLGTLATYSMTSHLCHFDWTGVCSRQEQMANSQADDAYLWDTAHCLRILSNVMSMELFRVTEYLCNSKVELLKALSLSTEVLDFINQIDQYITKIAEEKINLK